MNRYDEDEVYRSILNACVLAVSEGFPHLAVRDVIAPPHGWRDAELARQVVAYLMAAEFELPKRRIAQVQECDRKRIRSAVFTIGARLIESRILARCCFENKYWVVALAGQGEKFVREMLHDEMNGRQRRATRFSELKLPLDPKVMEELEAWRHDSKKRYQKPKKLNPMDVAKKNAEVGKSYPFYELLSSDAAHVSLSSLERHAITNSREKICGIDVDPDATVEEVVETLQLLCLAVIGVLVGVNEIVDYKGNNRLSGLAERFTALGNETKARNDNCKSD